MTHVLAILALFISLFTGLRISLVSHQDFAWLSAILPQGRVHTWHFYAGILLTCVAIYFVYYYKQLKRPTHNLKLKTRYHRLVNQFGYVVLILTLATGWIRWLSNGALAINANWHYYCVFGVVLYLFLHSYIYWLEQGARLVSRLIPRKLWHKKQTWITGLVCISGAVFVYAAVLTTAGREQLTVTPLSLDTFIDIDGQALEPNWQKAQSVTVHTYGGANFVDGQTQVEIKAMANEDEVYFLFRWADPTASLQHLPLEKTAQGWQVKGHGFYQYNETQYYEDKFAVMLSETCAHGADGTAHLGPQPLKNKPKNTHSKGYHASLDGKTRDLWHWKAVRTNDMFLADDNFIGAPLKPQTGSRRYTAGYATDSHESGVYVMNWQWYSQHGVTPKRLPISPSVNKSPSEKAIGTWFDYQPYQTKHDTYPIGTLLPSVLYRSNRIEGDRADVRARGHWQAGFWTLEMVRKRDTGSTKDLRLQDNTCLWVSAFDASQIAHTRHDRPLQLAFLTP
ncbi:ethylbenzene dehydrogenase-related protein [Pseudoalteromonas ulvae]|uniref:ethylbenzene dehydrogenase-related protein n=1 Tax=Pseudoalteromonas ulvae TaxID=107327 RepID=UPI0038654BC5